MLATVQKRSERESNSCGRASADKMSIPRVGLVWGVERLYGSDAIRGVSDYARRHGPWEFLMNQSHDIDLSQDRTTEVDGIIVCQDWPGQLHAAMWPTNVPIISLDRAVSAITPRQIQPDDQAVGRLVADDFIRRGFRRFAYCRATDFQLPIDTWDLDRWEGFRDAVRNAGTEPLLYDNTRAAMTYEKEVKRGQLADWLKSLPKPVGIMAANDIRGRFLLVAAEMAGVRVPEEVAVIGVNNEPWAEIAFRGLSSVELDGYRAGYAGAELLRKLMEKQPVGPGLIRIPPRRLVTRQSSDALAIDDPDVVTAVRFIAERAAMPIEVRNVVDAVPLSRRVLERRFKEKLNRSIQEEIRLAHIARAKDLLIDESIPLDRVARMSGFPSAKTLGAIFRRVTGTTPTAHRAAIRTSRKSS
jgi:LacI family transcriptional regulator